MKRALVVRSLGAVALILFTGMLTSLLITGDFETLGAGCMIASWTIPLSAVYLMVLKSKRDHAVPTMIYLTVSLLILGTFLYWYKVDPPAEGREIFLYATKILAGSLLGGFLAVRTLVSPDLFPHG